MGSEDRRFEVSTGRMIFSRREVLVAAGAAVLSATLPFSLARKSIAAIVNRPGLSSGQGAVVYPEWIAEARIYGMSVPSVRLDPLRMNIELDRVLEQGANVIEADSGLSDYMPEEDFVRNLQTIRETTKLMHERGLKAVWYIPSLEVITPNGRFRSDSFGKVHSDWLQLSFDRESRGVFYGQRVFWVEKNDESAWLCPNSPFREWIKSVLMRLAETGVDGIWLDVPLFDMTAVKWGCSCRYCQEKFKDQTGLEFPTKMDMSDKTFWSYVQWRHRTLTEFLEDCKRAIVSVNPEAITIAEVVTTDYLGATQHGLEGSAAANHFVVWEADAISETTGMAEGSYFDWLALHSTYKYCRGATMDRPSWAFSYGYGDSDAQLVMASTIASQNNPYELRVPKMTTTVGMEFRGMMYNWIASHSKRIFRSKSLSPVAILYSERNRDFLDGLHSGGLYESVAPVLRDRKWLGKKGESFLSLEYMGDYRGLSILLFQNQIPSDIFPMSRVDRELLKDYKVIVLPYMAILAEAEKEMLLQAVHSGATLIVSGPEPGKWDTEGSPRDGSLWADILGDTRQERSSFNLGAGRVCFWRKLVGREYIRTRDHTFAEPLLSWLKDAGVESWVSKKLPVVVEPYVYERQLVIHVLNYSWVGGLENRPRRLPLELSIPWGANRTVESALQSEPQWGSPKELAFSRKGNRLLIPLEVGINSMVIVTVGSEK